MPRWASVSGWPFAWPSLSMRQALDGEMPSFALGFFALPSKPAFVSSRRTAATTPLSAFDDVDAAAVGNRTGAGLVRQNRQMIRPVVLGDGYVLLAVVLAVLDRAVAGEQTRRDFNRAAGFQVGEHGRTYPPRFFRVEPALGPELGVEPGVKDGPDLRPLQYVRPASRNRVPAVVRGMVHDNRHPVPGVGVRADFLGRVVERALAAVENAGDDEGERRHDVLAAVPRLPADSPGEIQGVWPECRDVRHATVECDNELSPPRYAELCGRRNRLTSFGGNI
jgi:hypothetical protein